MPSRSSLLLPALLVALVAHRACSLDNGVKPTPAMGFSTWNFFQGHVNATLLMQLADAMVASGLQDAGYEYINLDDGWAVGRDKDGVIIEDPRLFPQGLGYVADYIHSRGLKFGIYTSRTSLTCMGRPGSDGYEKIDALTYANKFHADYLKDDSCGGTEHGTVFEQYARMRDALNATGRTIYYSICQILPWSDDHPFQYCNRGMAYTILPWLQQGLDPRTLANSFLIEYCNNYDVFGVSGGVPRGWPATAGFLSNLDSQQYLTVDYMTAQGAFNDNDMLECCNGGQTQAEYRAQFSLWCIQTSPLILGNDIRHMDNACLEVVTNKEVIAVNQDKNVVRGRLVYQQIGFGPNSPSSSPYPSSASPPSSPSSSSPRGGIKANSSELLTVVYLDTCGQGQQQWEVGRADNTVRAVTKGQELGCLDIYNCSTKMADNLFLSACHPGQPGCGSSNQEWFLATNGSYGPMKTLLDNSCLTGFAGSGLLSTLPCVEGERERMGSPSGSYPFSSSSSSYPLPSPSPPSSPLPASAPKLHILDNSTSRSQLFAFNATDSTIRSTDGRCLTVGNEWSGNDVTVQIYAKPLADGSVAVAVFNRATVPIKTTIPWALLGIPPVAVATVRDLWLHVDVGAFEGGMTVVAPPHDALMYKIKASV